MSYDVPQDAEYSDADSQRRTGNYPVINFFRGKVSSDRVQRENITRGGALAYWRCNTTKQQAADYELINRINNPNVKSSAIPYSSPYQSTGMGLEAQNLQVFITGNHSIISPPSPPPSEKNVKIEDAVVVQPPPSPMPVVTNSSEAAPAKEPDSATVYNYRRKKSLTFSNLLRFASNQ